LEQWGLFDLIDRATLLVSEIVTNAVRHAASGSILTLSVANEFLEIGVMDSDAAHLPVTRKAVELSAESGRGLALVEALSDEWGTTLLPGGKNVWFRIRLSE
jgi:anti-sigma regulatory factor (Ser/Thr protein kinase)